MAGVVSSIVGSFICMCPNPGNMRDILSSIPDFFSTINSYLPENRFVKVIAYSAGGVIILQLFPYVTKHMEFMAYFYRQKAYFHRTNSYIIEKKKKLLQELRLGTADLPLVNDRDVVILEINAGGGSNLSYFPDGAVVITTDLSADQEELIRQNFESEVNEDVLMSQLKYDRFIHTIPEELINVPDCSVSAVVCFHGLCSARNVYRAVAEIKRVLKPGGKYYFIEHVPDVKLFSWRWFQQIYVLPAFAMVSCRVGRPIQKVIHEAEFSEVHDELYREDLDRAEMYPIRTLSPHLYGYAVK